MRKCVTAIQAKIVEQTEDQNNFTFHIQRHPEIRGAFSLKNLLMQENSKSVFFTMTN